MKGDENKMSELKDKERKMKMLLMSAKNYWKLPEDLREPVADCFDGLLETIFDLYKEELYKGGNE